MKATRYNIKYKFLSIIPAIGVMILIFYFSSQDATHSSNLSGGFVTKIYKFVEDLFGISLSVPDRIIYLDIMETFIRKLAHMSEYALLAITVAYALFVYDNKGWKLILWTVSVCVLYAISDEIHQLFVPGRSCQALDVFIDGCGALIGCLLIKFVNFLSNYTDITR